MPSSLSKLLAGVRVILAEWCGTKPPADYTAVTVARSSNCCAAARATQDKPLLVRSLPRLPLPGCSMPQSCRCEFREWPDRRIGDRRLQRQSGDDGDDGRANSERRGRRERRAR